MLPSYDLLSDLLLENGLLRDKNSDLENEIEKLNNEGAKKWAKGIDGFMRGIIVGIIVGAIIEFIAIK